MSKMCLGARCQGGGPGDSKAPRGHLHRPPSAQHCLNPSCPALPGALPTQNGGQQWGPPSPSPPRGAALVL